MIDEETIKQITNELGLPSYDVLLLGDASGTIATKASGWACIYYLPLKNETKLHFGATTLGTNNFAELCPYLNVLWLDNTLEKVPTVIRRVEIVSDSELSVKCGNREYSRNANLPLWAGFDCLERLGYRIHWNHVPRNSNLANSLCDKVAGQVRSQIEKMQLTTQNGSCKIE